MVKYLNNIGLNFHNDIPTGRENNGLVRTSSIKTIKEFYNKIYEKADLKLERKYNKFQEFLQYF